MKKIYIFFQTNIGLIILVCLGYIFIWGFSDRISYHLGELLQTFLPSIIIFYFFKRKYRWTNRQMLVNSLLLSFIWKLIMYFWYGYRSGLALKNGLEPEYTTIELFLGNPTFYFLKPFISLFFDI